MDCGARVYCTASPGTLRILDSVQNESLRLATGAFRSSPILSLYVESNVLPLDLHRESLTVEALPRPYFLPSSPLRPLLTSEDLASSSWKVALLVHPRFLDAGHRGFQRFGVQIRECPSLDFSSCLYLFIFVEAG